MVDAAKNTAEDVDDPHIFNDPRIDPLDEDHLDDIWSASSLLDSAKAEEEAEAAAAGAGAAKQRTCSPIECLLKVNKYTIRLENYEKNHTRTMQVDDMRQLLLNTVSEVNRQL